LCRGRIVNKIKYINDKIATKKVAPRNVPFITRRWPVVKLKHLYKFKTHPLFLFPFKEKFIDIGLDLTGWTARDNGDPDNTYNQLIAEKRQSPEKTFIRMVLDR